MNEAVLIDVSLHFPVLKGRWYLLSKDYADDCIKTFALDRIHELEMTKKKFTYP